MIESIRKLYQLLIDLASKLQPVLLLAVRLYWGYQFTQTGWGKLNNLGRVTHFFGSLGIPAPAINAAFISGLEVVGGILLALGLGSRLVSLLFVGDMFVAYVAADREALLSFFTDPDKFVGAAPCTFLCASLLILIFGPGPWSLDAAIGRRFTKTQTAA